jgi:hypothetical protein
MTTHTSSKPTDYLAVTCTKQPKVVNSLNGLEAYPSVYSLWKAKVSIIIIVIVIIVGVA